MYGRESFASTLNASYPFLIIGFSQYLLVNQILSTYKSFLAFLQAKHTEQVGVAVML
jgi:hypothetical protein